MSLQKLVFIGLLLLTLGMLLLAWQLNQAAHEVDEVRAALVASSSKTIDLFDRLEGSFDNEQIIADVHQWTNSSARMNELLARFETHLRAGDVAASRVDLEEFTEALAAPSAVGEELAELGEYLRKDETDGASGGQTDARAAKMRAATNVVARLRRTFGDAARISVIDAVRARASRGHLLAGAASVFSFVLFVALVWTMSKLRAERQLIERDREAQRLRRVAYGDRARVLSSVNQLTEVFGETRDVHAVLDEAARGIREILDVDNIALELYGSEDSGLRRHIVDGVGGDIDLGDEIYDDVIGRGQSRLINRLDSTSQYTGLAKRGFRSLLVTPLVRNHAGGEKEPIGYVAALCEKRRDFTTHDQWLLNTFARQASLIIENAQLYEKTQQMAMHDGLTNLYNHRRFRDVLDTLLAEAAKRDAPLGLVMGDIDHFKNYNDSHGHLKGDVVLRTVGEILRTNVRGADMAARYGGEEFVLLLPDTDLHGCRLVGENLRSRIQQQEFEGQDKQPGGNLTITFGLAMFPADGQDAESLIEAADRALYAGKHLGRNRLVTAAEMPDLEKEHGEAFVKGKGGPADAKKPASRTPTRVPRRATNISGPGDMI